MRNGLLKFIFSWKMLTLVLILVQIFIIFAGFYWLSEYQKFFFGGFTLLSLILTIYIFNKPGNPAFKMSWMVIVLAFPILGGGLYLFIQTNIGTIGVAKRLRHIFTSTKSFAKQDPQTLSNLLKTDKDIYNLANYVLNSRNYPIYENSKATYYPLGENGFKEMIDQLKKAKKFIFLEYFIIEDGIMWSSILEVLKQKVKEGVEVRVMYDGTCSIALLPINYPKQLESFGIKVKMFAPIKPALSTHQNNRDHRKILVIDNKIAFTGGINLADEYINQKKRFGHWKDVVIMIEGEAVSSFTLMFLQMWNIKIDKNEYEKYLKDIYKVPTDGYILPYSEIPITHLRVAENVYLSSIYNAKEYIHIMTPYLIIDNEMITALNYAAASGIDVSIIMPHIPDKKLAFNLAKSYYPELIKGGVKIYEYTPGFIHAKSFVSDDIKAIVGTINLDYRSLYLHYECATYLYKCQTIKDIEEDFKQTLKKCELITIEKYKKNKLIDRFIGKVLRLFAPLM